MEVKFNLRTDDLKIVQPLVYKKSNSYKQRK